MEPAKKQIEIPGYLKISKAVVWFLYFFVIIGIVSLVLRVILLLFNADRTVGFSKLIGDISGTYLEPFRGIFPPKIGETGSYLDVSALFAILVYLFVLWGVHSLVNYVQNKIDITRAQQEKELAEIKRQKELAAMKARKVVVERTVRTSKAAPRKKI